MKKTKAKAAPAIKWEKLTDYDNCATSIEWDGYIGGKEPVFKVSPFADTTLLFLLGLPRVPPCPIGRYKSARAAKRGAERFAKQMRVIFAEDGK